jgi:hypothetical protein
MDAINMFFEGAQHAAAGPPRVVPSRLADRAGVIAEHRRQFESVQRIHMVGFLGGCVTSTSSVSAFRHGRAPTLASLTSITLREVAAAVNKPHCGRVLFAVVVGSPGVRLTGVSVVVEDVDGDVTTLFLCVRACVRVCCLVCRARVCLGLLQQRLRGGDDRSVVPRPWRGGPRSCP